MNWDHLRYFSRVATEGSVAAAGRRLGVSHATVLRAVQRLEAELGVRLFDPLRTGYRLTPEGAEFHEHVTRMALEADAIQRKARGTGDEPEGELTVSLPEPDLIDLMPLLGSFAAGYPRLSVDLRVRNTVTPETMLADDIRVSFILTNDPPEELVGRRIDSIRFAPACKSGAVDDVPMWIDWEPEFLDAQTRGRMRVGSGAVQRTTIAGSYSAAISAVRAGMGAALLTRRDPDDQFDWQPGAIDVGVWVLTHPAYRGDTRVRALMAFVAASLSPAG